MPMVTVSCFQAKLAPNTALDSVSLVRSMRYKTRTSGHASQSYFLARLRGSAIRHGRVQAWSGESSAVVFLDRKLVMRQDRGAASSGRLRPAEEQLWKGDFVHRVSDQQDEVKQISHLSSAMRYAKIEVSQAQAQALQENALQGLGRVRSMLVSRWLKMTSIRKSFCPTASTFTHFACKTAFTRSASERYTRQPEWWLLPFLGRA